MIDDFLSVGGGCPLLSEVHDVGAADTTSGAVAEGFLFHQLTLELHLTVASNEYVVVQRAVNVSRLSATTAGPLLVVIVIFAGSAAATAGVEIKLGRACAECLQGSG